MKISKQVYQIKVYFHVTEEIERFVNVYVIEGKKGCYLIDTGVAGAEKLIKKSMNRFGKQNCDLKAIFLTHSHPDHMGAAAYIKKRTGAQLFGSSREQGWIEDIDRQFAARPIPNFYKLVNDSVHLDEKLEGGEVIRLEEGVTIRPIATPGHSAGSMSYFFEEEQILFTGDAVPIPGDIPIYTSYRQSMESLDRIDRLQQVHLYCSAWADTWALAEGRKRIAEAREFLKGIHEIVGRVLAKNEDLENAQVFKRVCEKMGIDGLKANPLFRTSIYANIEEWKGDGLGNREPQMARG
ncbi:MBL fold metallo-hydrolase [Anaerovorax odorimutans]|uniref:MBL fold metallo-hydrolase n=1 Tax=Anaerovorax odorimutans TaxID=109327 RepID=A0ABT1RNU2_9FIRM|nr:MBL fold metallo-hydrolase [Anaerovorax odorimutans]MCQ4636859.1 MBL fold metallo-hydrolase [Anaerovorax odorimutans]